MKQQHQWMKNLIVQFKVSKCCQIVCALHENVILCFRLLTALAKYTSMKLTLHKLQKLF